MKNIILTALIPLLFLSGHLQAESYSYEGIHDFEVLDAGEIPYYKDSVGQRDVLAINAANTQYREKYARASTTFTHQNGQYDIQIDALSEVDGECIYRFLVNGEIKGSAENKRTEVDYAVQSHIFHNIQLVEGDIISVESVALSNGLIPENDEFAFARGRWKTLTLTENTVIPPPSVDLSLTSKNARQIITTNSSVILEFEVKNNSTITATAPQVSATLPEGLSFISSADCVSDEEQIICHLPEISANETQQVSFELSSLTEGKKDLQAIVSADQFDNNMDNNNTSIEIITPKVIPAKATEEESNHAGASTIWLYLGMIGVFIFGKRKRNHFRHKH